MFCRAQFARLRQARWFFTVVALSLVAPYGNSVSAVDGSQQVVRVEETWELVVGDPDTETSGPQITCAISPVGNLYGRHCLLTLNHRNHPTFSAGGLQLQVWENESLVSARKHPNESLLATSGETVRWTMKMSLQDGGLIFDVDDGVSTTWGNFGTQGYLWDFTTANLPNLNGYDPAVSVANSGVGFASNRVQSLVLKKVRYVLSSGQIVDDNTARVAYSQE